MADICTQDIKTSKKFTKTLTELKVPVASQAKDVADRANRIAKGQEVLARGQHSTPTDEAVVKEIRSRLNKVITDCAPLDVTSGKVDREMEQRVALFQTRHVATDKRFNGPSEVDGIIGKKSYLKLMEMSTAEAPPSPQARAANTPVPTPKTPANAPAEAKSAAQITEKPARLKTKSGTTEPTNITEQSTKEKADLDKETASLLAE